MNTSSILFDRSREIPEGLYLELMNSLKKDFYGEQIIFVVNKSIPSKIVMSRDDLIQQIIKNSTNWVDREEILLKITKKRGMLYHQLKELCVERHLPIMKDNPRWVKQEEIAIQTRDEMRRIAPRIINLH